MPKPGVTYISTEKRWKVYYYVRDPSKKGGYRQRTQSFSEAKYGSQAQDKAEEAAERFDRELSEWGSAGVQSGADRSDADAARAILRGRMSVSDAAHIVNLALDFDVPTHEIPDAVKFWAKNKPQDITEISLSDAIESFLHQKQKSRRATTVVNYEHQMDILGRAFQGRMINSLTRAEVMRHIESRGAPGTQHGHFRGIHTLLNYAVKQGWVANNVIRGEKGNLPEIDGDIVVLSSVDGPRLLAAAESVGRYVGALAIMYYTGMRQTTMHRILWSNVDRVGQQITIPKKADKNKNPEVIDKMPEQLWVWLEKYFGDPDKPVSPPSSTWQKYLQAVRREVGEPEIPWGGSALRKSFASHSYYYCGLEKTLDTMCHTQEPAVFRKHYKGYSNDDRAKEYFEVYPKK